METNKTLFHHNNTRFIMAFMLFILAVSTTYAQQHDRYTPLPLGDERGMGREYIDFYKQLINNDNATRYQSTKTLPFTDYLLSNDAHIWTDGWELYYSCYDPEEKEVYFDLFSSYLPPSEQDRFPSIRVKGKKLNVVDHPGATATVESIAGHIMLVMRNNAGTPVKAMYHVTEAEYDKDLWALLALNTIMGNYAVPNGENAVFGVRMDFYSVMSAEEAKKAIDILYANGRVSQGDPSSPNWGKMPGGGGAKALMGPMEWNIKPTIEGLRAIVIRDERFVTHMPSIGQEGDTVMLTKLQCPYEGLQGKWTFASVVPLTDAILQLFPVEVLTLMKAEIYARHGDTFKNADTQRYFDEQPWYHRGDTHNISLTDVERFNYQLIKQVEAAMSQRGE